MRGAAELTARDFVNDAVVIAPNDDELVAAVELCRLRVASVAEQADKLADSQPGSLLVCWI